MGEFNIDLRGDNNRSPLADYLLILQSIVFVSIVNLPTRITSTSQTIIDHIFTNDSVSVITPEIFTYQISDHRPIFCTLTDQSINFLNPLILGGSRGQQLELNPPSISILCDKGHMLCWDAKARPTKIFYVISPSSSGTASRHSTNRC